MGRFSEKLVKAGVLVSLVALTGCGGAMRSTSGPPMRTARPLEVVVAQNLERLIQEEDTDGDKKITIKDTPQADPNRGDRRFQLIAANGKRYEVAGTYPLSNLLQELKLAEEAKSGTVEIELRKIFENPVQRISRSIRDIYWDSLTRRIDGDNLEQVLQDEKVPDGEFRHLYVPQSDTQSYEYFSRVAEERPELQLRVEQLPGEVTPDYVRGLDGQHGVLSLALVRAIGGKSVGLPFVVPGGRFNEMYGWDSYFIALGLLEDDRVELAKGIVDNLVYQINHYGKILNANRTYYLTRSQPPFLTSLATAVYRRLPRDQISKAWLREVLAAAIKEYHEVWMSPDRLTKIGLSRYFGSGIGPPPEVEPGHFDAVYRPYAAERGLDVRSFERSYKAGEIIEPELDRFFVHDRCVRESGHDTTYRWNLQGDRCSDFVTVDLNSLLYKTELDLARVINREFDGALELADDTTETSKAWYKRADKRRNRIRRYLWDKKRGMLFDYDLVNKKRHPYVSATGLYPLWAWNGDDPPRRIFNTAEARKIAETTLALLEMPGGVAASGEESRDALSDARPARQWDYPNGWAPHQMLIWRGLLDYGFNEMAHRLIYRWLYTITRNAADYNGTIPEKLDVVRRSHEVFAEYGNVGTEFAYITREGFGWMNASYQVGLSLLPPSLRASLENLVPPEWIFDR